MLFPQFSLRWVLGVITAFGGFFLVLNFAAAGHVWATAVAVAVVSLALAVAVYVAIFFIVWLFSFLVPVRKQNVPIGRSPFASEGTVYKQLMLAGILAMGLATPAVAQAPSGNLSPKTAAKGLTMQVDTRWVAGSGYRPVRVELAPVAPLVDTRTVDLQFRALSWYGRQREYEVAQAVDIPPGMSKVQVTLSVPEHLMWNAYDVEVFENGRPIEKLSQLRVGLNNSNVDVLEGLPTMLVIGIQPIDTSHLVEALKAQGLMSQYQSSGGMGGGLGGGMGGGFGGGMASSLPANLQLSTVIRRNVDELPGRWIEYSSLDVVCLSVGELDQLVTQQPGRWKALRDWTAAGGNLWVYDAGGEWQRLQRIEAALSLPAQPSEEAIDPALRGWTLPDRFDFKQDLDSAFSDNMANWQGNPEPELIGEQATKATSPVIAPSNDFLTRPYQLGLVAAFSSADPLGVGAFSNDALLWRWRLNTIGPDRLLWVRRHGLSTRRENSDFWNFLVPGVGLVPVTAFRVLITIFMVAIGPLNYYWLRRTGRLHLLVMIVPLSAAVITGTLFGYAVIGDGFDVRVRARSFTHIDQRNAQAVCWSRLSYYAGLAPAGGLIFPEDVAVLPLDPVGAGSERSMPDRRMRWYDDSQVLADGWLASRTSTQFMTVRSRPSNRGIDLLNGDAPRIKNRLGSAIRIVVIAAADASLLVARSVANDAIAEIRPADRDRDLADLYTMLADQRLAVPLGLDPQRYSLFGMRTNWSYSQWNNGLPNTSLNTSVLEKRLQDFSVWPSLGQRGALRPASYVAVVDRSPETLFGTEPVQEEASLHVIVGEW